MSRRRRTHLAEDLTTALSLLPWWACLIVALAAYAFLHTYATSPIRPIAPGSRGLPVATIYSSAFHGLASAGQYVLPLICIAAAVMSFLGRRQRRALLIQATEGGAFAAAIDAMGWQDFELLVAEAFRLQGFAVAEKGGAGPDGGVDMELTKDNERRLVQVKHWRARQVPVEVVRELAGVMSFRRAVGAYVVTSGRFTAPAEEFARGRGIELINGTRLDNMLTKARASLEVRRRTRRESLPPAAVRSVPACPTCSRPMLLRTAKKGRHTGREFWGCASFPQCKGMREAQRPAVPPRRCGAKLRAPKR